MHCGEQTQSIKGVKKLLWVDDRISSFSSYIESMKRCGVHVVTADSTSEAKKAVSQNTDFDVTLIDLLLPTEGGVELLREFGNVLPNTKHIILSSYTDIDVLEEGIEKLGFNIKTISKRSLPEFNSKEFSEVFVPALFSKSKGLDEYEMQNSTDTHSLFDITLSEFTDKPFSERAQLNGLVRSLVEKELKSHFNNNKIWALFCGSDEAIATASKVTDIWPEERVMDYAQSINRAPYQFMKQIEADDLSWAVTCSEDNGTKDYPTVTLKFDHDVYTIHFDTGCPLTLMDRDYWKGKGLVHSVFPIEGSTSKGPYWGTEFRQEGLIIDQDTEETKRVSVIGVAVESWLSTQFSRTCPGDCGRDGPYERHCKYRTGLMGRNLLVDNALSLILDGKSEKTRLLGED